MSRVFFIQNRDKTPFRSAMGDFLHRQFTISYSKLIDQSDDLPPGLHSECKFCVGQRCARPVALCGDIGAGGA